MFKKKAIINIYNFIRMSNNDPSVFIPDDFETIKNELIFVKQHGFPGTYPLKYDAVTDPRYQALLKDYLDENDEISAWWEITEPLCQEAGVSFKTAVRDGKTVERVNRGASMGYTPEERKKIVDAYMAGFFRAFGKYPETIGGWILDSVTLQYAADKYGIVGGAICRDQMGVDGFTLWGGYPTGPYYPSRKNEFVPAQTEENQMTIPVFRLLGPDPIYNFEDRMRPEHGGIYTLEPAWLAGRDPNWIRWIFTRLTDEDSMGNPSLTVGQENGFLWENIEPGFEKQLDILEDLMKTRDLRIETMGATARWFRKQYTRTPPTTFQASYDWDRTMNLSTMWYTSAGYRISFLGEQKKLRIRDFFIYDENYCSRYLKVPTTTHDSFFDALAVLSPNLWETDPRERPFIRLLDDRGHEPEGEIEYHALSDSQAVTTLGNQAKFTLTPGTMTLEGSFRLHFDYLPNYTLENDRVVMVHNGYRFFFRVSEGSLKAVDDHVLEILPVNGGIRMEIMPAAEGAFRIEADIPDPVMVRAESRPLPPMMPKASPASSAFLWGTAHEITLTAPGNDEIRYTLDGTEPSRASERYTRPIPVTEATELRAKTFRDNGTESDTACFTYRFSLKNLTCTSPTVLDPRDAFTGRGMASMNREELRGTVDYLCGQWKGTTDTVDITGVLEAPEKIASVTMGFLTAQRTGIVYPDYVELYAGPDKDHMTLRDTVDIPNEPGPREIRTMDVTLALHDTVGAVRVVAHPYDRMPDWTIYAGIDKVFTLADCLIVTPEA